MVHERLKRVIKGAEQRGVPSAKIPVEDILQTEGRSLKDAARNLNGTHLFSYTHSFKKLKGNFVLVFFQLNRLEGRIRTLHIQDSGKG